MNSRESFNFLPELDAPHPCEHHAQFLVGIEHLTDDELEKIRTQCKRLAEAEKVGEAAVERTGKKRNAPPTWLPNE